jgi:hypothetical protein
MIMLLRQQALKPWVDKAANRLFGQNAVETGFRSQEKNKQRHPQSSLNPESGILSFGS